MVPFAIILIFLALLLLWQSRQQTRQAGLPVGKIIYTDMRGWNEVTEPLYDPVYHLTGKPDYLVEQQNALIPVEVKSGRTPDAPYDAHIFQLAAYCLLVERTYSRRPSYGIIKYPKRTFSVPYTKELEQALIALLGEMEWSQRARQLNRSHAEPARCQGCGFKNTCDQQL